MQEFDAIQRIRELCAARAWSVYRLAKQSGIPYSTLNSMLQKTGAPSLPTLAKICDGFQITLAQFFSDGEAAELLRGDQVEFLEKWEALDDGERGLVLAYIRGLADGKN